MKAKSPGLVVVACVVALVVAGCATAERRSFPPSGTPGHNSSRDCDWTFTYDVDNKIQTGSLHATPKTPGAVCTVDDKPRASGRPLFIGEQGNQKPIQEWRVGGEFITPGSCRYCYINASGGMSCVTYPNC